MKTLPVKLLTWTVPWIIAAGVRAAEPPLSAAQQAALERVKKDVPKFQEWTLAATTLAQTLTVHLAPLSVVELSPKGAPQVSLWVLASNDPKPQTWRPTNDADLAAIVDRCALKKTYNAADPTLFAQLLATLRCAPDEAKLINSAADIPPQQGGYGQPVKPDVLSGLAAKIRKLEVKTQNGETQLEFFFLSQLGGGVFQMSVTMRPNAPTQLQTIFHGYAYFTTR